MIMYVVYLAVKISTVSTTFYKMETNQTSNGCVGPIPTFKPRTTIPTTNDSYKDIVFYIKFVIFIFGCTGNLFCCYIWTKKDFTRMPRSFSCIILSINNTIYLILNISHVGYSIWNDTYRYFATEFGCRFVIFGVGFTSHMDSWIIILLTAERLIAGNSDITVMV